MTIFNEYLALLRQVGAAMDMSLQGNQAYRRKLLQNINFKRTIKHLWDTTDEIRNYTDTADMKEPPLPLRFDHNI